MYRDLVMTALTLAGAGPMTATLQGQQPGASQDMERGPRRVMQFVMSRRARIGLKVNLQARATDSVGAYVDAVTPNGPAANAGIQSGDIITKVDGSSVLSGRPSGRSGERESLPGLRLIELVARLEPNDTVPIELRRGNSRKTMSVVTADEPDISFQGGPGGRGLAFRYFRPDGRARMQMGLGDDLESLGGMGPLLYGSPLAELELAPLNPDLGQYFGTTTGILVVSVPPDSDLKLKGGDVILAVDGRKPASPSHLLRILRSYEQGESFKLDILRKQKRETVTGKVGDRPTN
jgi:S1-C subfamily serine protease